MVALRPELWFNRRMDKERAITLLGGSIGAAANAIGVSYQAIEKWPDPLPPRIADRVVAAIARQKLPAHELGLDQTAEQAPEANAA